jgi:PII-like signaling protein
MDWILDRLKEASTWRGVTVLLGAIGIGVSPDLVAQIGLIVTAIIGAIEILRKEKV